MQWLFKIQAYLFDRIKDRGMVFTHVKVHLSVYCFSFPLRQPFNDWDTGRWSALTDNALMA